MSLPWIILGIIAIIGLVITFFKDRNSVWGGLTLGIIVGLIIALIKGFDWLILVKGGIIGTLTGVVFSLVGKKPKIK